MDQIAVYTYGGGEILAKIFNGLAMIFSAGEEGRYFTLIAQLSAFIGGLWAVTRALTGRNLGMFARDWFLPTYLIITVLLGIKIRVEIIDEVNLGHRHHAVDNVPLGIALVSGLSSDIAKHLTETIESYVAPVDSDAYKYTKTGSLFGAKLLASTKELTLSNPNMRENVKKFMNQCFTWPYILTNVAGKRDEAAKTDDLLNFMRENAHPSLGMYWQDETGKSEFKKCAVAVGEVQKALESSQLPSIKVLKNLTGFAQSSSTVANNALKRYTGDAWSDITRESKRVHDITSQQMLMNAYREGYDDMRESHGHNRLYPNLVAMQATRGIMQQNMGWLVGGAIASEYLPIAQTVIFAILLCAFFIVIPMSFMPGGLSVIGGWVKMILWIQSWPIFFAIITAIGAFALEQRISSVGSGLNLLTQEAFAQTAFNTYCMVQNLLLTVPVISWVIMSKGASSLMSVAEKLAPAAASSTLGSSMVDNTHNIDNISMGNRTVATEQIAQQNSGALINTGISFDQGTHSTRIDGSGGQVFTDNVSQLKNNVNLVDAETASMTKQAERSLQVANTQSVEAAKQDSLNTGQAVDLMERWGTGVSGIQGYSQTQNQQLDESLQYLKNQGVSVADVASSIGANSSKGSLSGGLSLNFGKNGILSGSIGANLTGETTASDQDSKEFKEQSSQSQDHMQRVQEALMLAKEGRVTTTYDSSASLAKTARSSYDQVQSLRESSQTAKSDADRYAQAAGYLNTVGSQVNTNINDDVLKHVAQTQFGGDVAAAANWQRTNSKGFKEKAGEYLANTGFDQRVMQMVESGQISKEGINQAWEEARSGHLTQSVSMKERASQKESELTHSASEKNVHPEAASGLQQVLSEKVESRLNPDVQGRMDQLMSQKTQTEKAIEAKYADLSNRVQEDRSKTTIKRAGGRILPGQKIDKRVETATEKIRAPEKKGPLQKEDPETQKGVPLESEKDSEIREKLSDVTEKKNG